MKKKFILAGLLSLFFSLKGQRKDTVFRKDTVSKFDIEAMYGHYIQDGNNSAVTGGIGTEKLSVYSPSFKIKRTGTSGNILSLKTGVDIITSASTDKIDYIVSSASIVDARTYANIAFTTRENKQLQWTFGTGFSIESDYFSLPFNIGVSHQSKNRMRTLTSEIQMYSDDLRWGRLNAQAKHHPVKLIYPSELRYQQWHETSRRQSLNLKTSWQQIINKRSRMGLFPELTYQNGLLATPFHRVYFTDNSLRVENLPSQRIKGLLGLKFYRFAGGRTILKNTIDLYADDFGILAIGLENETAIKLNYALTLSPYFRVYFQKGSKYFAPYAQHLISDKYYTSDFDLSDFTSYKAGIGLRYAPYQHLSRKSTFNDIQLRYAFYSRSNGLHAHALTCVINGLLSKHKK
ncbi:MAG: DUF3570 domain-containing protein [Bacteroidota bacterium]